MCAAYAGREKESVITISNLHMRLHSLIHDIQTLVHKLQANIFMENRISVMTSSYYTLLFC